MSDIPALHRCGGYRVDNAPPRHTADAARRLLLASFAKWLDDNRPSAEEALQEVAGTTSAMRQLVALKLGGVAVIDGEPPLTGPDA